MRLAYMLVILFKKNFIINLHRCDIFYINTLSTLKLLNYAKKVGVKSFIQIRKNLLEI